MKFRQLCVLLALVVCAGSLRANSDALLARLQPQGYVNDFAGVFPAAQRTALETFLTDLERQTGVEIAVVAVPSLEGGEVDDFTNRLFQKWRIGKKGKDNGVMILAAIQDRKARIEVGYGLESVLPDDVAGRILREQMFPLFKQGRYGDGLTQAVQEVARIAGGGTALAPKVRNFGYRYSVDSLPEIPRWFPIALFVVGYIAWRTIRPVRWCIISGIYRSLSSGSGYSSGGGFSGGGGGFSGFGGGSSGGGGASGGW